MVIYVYGTQEALSCPQGRKATPGTALNSSKSLVCYVCLDWEIFIALSHQLLLKSEKEINQVLMSGYLDPRLRKRVELP